jgi:uncharacterized protein (DUF1800 family)
MTLSPAAIALNRFGLGARPDAPVPANPRAWLLDQFARYEPRPESWAGQPTSAAIAADYVADRMQLAAMPADQADKQETRKMQRQEARDVYLQAIGARTTSAFSTPAPFVERLVHFWANHFAVSADKALVIPFAGAFEAEAIRPHVLGRFEDMLLAVERHPAMQLYLDQAQSIGPNSPLALRAEARDPARKAGLNENLAREIMELHTLGVRTGYSQADVTEFARALTGWSVGGLGRGGGRADGIEPGSFVFRPAMHEPGARQIMSRAYAQPGEAQARAVLHDLASAPATADHIATKLARHFVADDPPPELVKRLAASFRETGGDLPALYRTLVEAPESWSTTAVKFKTPWEWLISSCRALGLREVGQMPIQPLLQQLGQPVWRPGSPAGFDDIAATWAAPGALMRRVEVAQRIAVRAGDRIDPRELAPQVLPASLSPDTADAIHRAESLPTGLALLLVSPDFQRR